MEITIRPHSLWSLCRVATTSSTPWDKLFPYLNLNFEVWNRSWSWHWQSSQRYWPISQWYFWEEKQKTVKTFIKVVKKLSSINVHFVMHGQSDSEESFSSVTSSAHGNHDKSNNPWKLIYRAKEQGECLNKFLNYRMLTTRHVNIQWKLKVKEVEIENFLFGDGSRSTLILLYRPKCSWKAKPEHFQIKLKRSHSVRCAPEINWLFPWK